eukprot:m.418017 g.418017  ORF g.418017 m.418017 type:complete len:81 (-) comp21288_c0_seq50:340-582(-)
MILATATQPYCTHKQSAVDCFDFCRRYERPVAIFLEISTAVGTSAFVTQSQAGAHTRLRTAIHGNTWFPSEISSNTFSYR